MFSYRDLRLKVARFNISIIMTDFGALELSQKFILNSSYSSKIID